ncbi:GIY-YIG nuclease family protein [Methylobacterium sp. D53M]
MGAERSPAYPLGSWPLEMRAETAAAYCQEPDLASFLEKVDQGIYSRPVGDDPPKWHREKLEADCVKQYLAGRRTHATIHGMIYVVGFDKYVKIGFTESSDAKGRIAEVQAGLPAKLTVYMTFPGTIADERELHERFKAWRLRGEWFRYEGEVSYWLRGLGE